ncbi:MAG: cysteine synthase family protein [Chloroflexi bacterium]|nr:cysteine synthase family protein [Chloroflexota bacterium]
MKYKNILDAIGRTPLVEIQNMSPRKSVRLFAKLEGQNPTGSLKDRIAKYMIEKAEAEGKLTRDRTILEPTSGNTGISLAMIGGLKGYKVKVVMPKNVSEERTQLIRIFGGSIVYTDEQRGTNYAIEVAKELAKKDESYFMPYQYGNEANPLAHYDTTGVEILRDLPNVDVFVAGLGTGGALMGIGRRLKEKNPETKVIAVVPYPEDLIQGLRSLDDGFIPPILDLSLLDSKLMVESKDAFRTTRELTEREGILAGISSGASVCAAQRVAQRMEKGNIVVLLADGGWRYLSTGLWTKSLGELEGELTGKIWW